MMRYVIIGNGTAAVNAVEAIRETDSKGSITVISDEAYEAYGRPLISYWLAGKVSDEKMVYRPAGFYTRHNVTLRLGVTALAIETVAKEVLLSDNSRLEYDKLLIATGGKPIVPPIDGLDVVGYHNFMKFDDARELDAKAWPGRTALVIGGGFIGLKACEALMSRGVGVELVEKAGWVLSTMLDREAAELVQAELEDRGVNLHTGVVATTVESDSGSLKVSLSNGTQLKVSFIVVAVGVIPRTDIAREAGLDVNRGILVDRCMHTSVESIYAAGDVTEAHDVLSGSQKVAAIMPNASQQGRIAGKSMAGVECRYSGSVPFNSVGVFGVSTISIGNAVSGEGDGYEVFTDINTRSGGGTSGVTGALAGGTSYRKIVVRDGRIQGAVFVNDLDRAGIIQGLIRDVADVTSFKDSLAKGDLSLITWPYELRKANLAK